MNILVCRWKYVEGFWSNERPCYMVCMLFMSDAARVCFFYMNIKYIMILPCFNRAHERNASHHAMHACREWEHCEKKEHWIPENNQKTKFVLFSPIPLSPLVFFVVYIYSSSAVFLDCWFFYYTFILFFSSAYSLAVFRFFPKPTFCHVLEMYKSTHRACLFVCFVLFFSF